MTADEIDALRQAGALWREIAEQAGEPLSTVYDRWRSAGHEPRRVRRSDVARLRAEGMTLREICAELGCSERTARRLARGAPHRRVRRSDVVRLRMEGMSVAQIAAELGCSERVAQMRLDSADLC